MKVNSTSSRKSVSVDIYCTAWKVCKCGVFSGRIFPRSDWIRRDTEYTHRGVFKVLWNISDGAFCENSWWLTAVICFHKKLYLNIWQGCEYGADSRKVITKILICISSNWEFCCFVVQFLSYKPQLLVQKPYSEVKAHLSAYMFPSFNHMAILFSSAHVCRNMFLAK